MIVASFSVPACVSVSRCHAVLLVNVGSLPKHVLMLVSASPSLSRRSQIDSSAEFKWGRVFHESVFIRFLAVNEPVFHLGFTRIGLCVP
jgi:hypothetical protein